MVYRVRLIPPHPIPQGLRELLAATCLFALITPFAVITEAANHPLLFTALFSVATTFAMGAGIKTSHPHLLRKEVLRTTFKVMFFSPKIYGKHYSIWHPLSPRFLLVPFGAARQLLLVFALRHINAAVVAIAFEAWPLLWLWCMAKATNGIYWFSKRTLLISVGVFGCLALVVFSGNTDEIGGTFTFTFGIAVLALLAAMMSQILAIGTFRQAEYLARTYSRNHQQESSEAAPYAALLFCFQTLGVGIITGSVFVITQTATQISNFALAGFVIAGGVEGIAFLFSIKGTMLGKNQRIQVVRYFTATLAAMFVLLLAPIRETIISLGGNVSDVLGLNWWMFSVGFAGMAALTLFLFVTQDNETATSSEAVS